MSKFSNVRGPRSRNSIESGFENARIWRKSIGEGIKE